MGNKNNKEILVNKANEKADQIMQEKKILESNILKEEINKRDLENTKKDNEKSKKKITDTNKKKFELNIFMYSDFDINAKIKKSIIQYNSEVFNWKLCDVLINYSEDNTQKILEQCETDFENKNFKNVIILPVPSFSYFRGELEKEGKDILEPFNESNEEQQPFFLIIDEDDDDFVQKKAEIELKFSEDNNEPNYEKFNDDIIHNVIVYKRKECDFQLKFGFFIELINKIKIFKDFILKLKEKNNDFEIYLNDEIFYQFLYTEENFDILSSNFEENMKREIEMKNNILTISVILYNVNINEYNQYFEIFEVKKAEFYFFEFKKEKLIQILRQKKYEELDQRNFNVIRFKQSPKNILLKYTGYFNQLGDILFCDQINYYPAKINIAVGGYIGSGKSTLINTIFEEKRCLEGQGSSITNYISQFALKDYPINFYDFPGFRAKSNGKDNTALFIEEIKSKISNLKKINEIIHCFLFCIKFQERIFDENDQDMIEVFDEIAKLKIRTFFIITGSEKEESRQFKKFKKIIINNLTRVKEKYKEEGDIIFGEDLNKSIIPILSRDKKFHGFTAKAFGLDNLFKVLYDYFLPKHIDYQKELFFDEERLKIFIQKNELLQVFESKNKLSKDLRDKIESQFQKMLMKIFLKAPKYLYTLSEESCYEIINEFMEQVYYLFDYYLGQKSNVEKLQIFNNLHDLKNKINKGLFNHLEEELKLDKEKNELKNTIPLAAKIIFPFLSPIYYILGTPIIGYFSKKIIKSMLESMEIDDLLYQAYFNEIINNLNKAIDDLDIIRNNFEDNYILEKLREVLIKIIENENVEISSNDLNQFKGIFTELLNKYTNPIKQFYLNDLFDSLRNYFPTKNDKIKENQINKKLKVLFSSIEEMVIIKEQIQEK